MAVRVRTGDTKTEVHELGTGLTVEDGHLVIKQGRGTNMSNLALYAPGAWLAAEKFDGTGESGQD